MVASSTVGASFPRVKAPSSFSLKLDGSLNLGEAIFKGTVPFLHDEGGSAFGNTALGRNALESITPGVPDDGGLRVTGVGSSTLQSNTTGSYNTAIGYAALRSNTTGRLNTAVGNGALTTSVVGGYSTAIGAYALHNSVSSLGSTAVGHYSLYSSTTGSNTAIGVRALVASIDGYSNTAVGGNALRGNTSGVENTAIGILAASRSQGSNNIAIGSRAGVEWTSGDNNIAIGSYGYLAQQDESGVIRIGRAPEHTRAYIAGIDGSIVSGLPVMVDSSNQLGTPASSARFKENIRDLHGTSERLTKLRPVSFSYRDAVASHSANPIQYGLVAEEVAEVFPELVIHDKEGRPFAVRYDLLTPLLLGEIQRQGQELAALRRRLDEM